VADRCLVNVETAVYRGDEYLLVRRADEEEHASGTMALVGGTVERRTGADVLERTVEREVREEVGVEVTDHSYVRNNAFVTDEGTPCVNLTYRSRYAAGEPRVREPDEVASVDWYTLAAALEDPSTPAWTEAALWALEADRE
jgi:8-oxo-dGTP diphosphatase